MNNYVYVLYINILFIGFSDAQFINSLSGFNSSVRSKRENTSFKCTLPRHPQNGRWVIINGEGNPGDQIDINTILKLECKPGYRLNPNIPLEVCDSSWDPEKFPKCEKQCPAFYSTVTTILKCIDRDGNRIKCDQAIDGTYLTYECIAYYEIPPGNKNSLFCKGGTWDFPKPVCQPVCGKKVNNETISLSWGGREVKDLEYPWVVAVYKKIGANFENVCGGTLVSRRVVLTAICGKIECLPPRKSHIPRLCVRSNPGMLGFSYWVKNILYLAAHCVTNDYGNPLAIEDFMVSAGKYYNALDDCRDEFAQKRKLSKLIVHDKFRGESQRFVADIAILVTKQLFQLGPVVQPICINNINNIYLSNRQIGEVAGWGLTENSTSADRLRVIKIPFKEGATCSRELPSEWEEKYNFFDKICAGHFQKNISVCKGDSGSGLVFKNREDSRYYIHGIVSIAPKLYSSQCNYETNALYTSISFYYGFIDREMTKNYVEDCVLPDHPKNGRWQLENDAQKNPKDIVPSTTILKFSCNRGYKLSSGSQYFECDNTYNTPTCKLRCPILAFPATTIVTCKNNREELIDCSDAVEGSSITFTCPLRFETDRGTQTSTRYCIGGTYGTPRPNCVLSKPGKLKTTPAPTSINDNLKVICTYVSWWVYNGVGPEDFDPNLCTHIVYEFIGLWDKGDVRVQDDALDLDQEERGLYNRVVDLKKKNKDLKVLLSVGGTAASNSSVFKNVTSHARKTGAFLGSVGYFIRTYHFDGINIDWQYPEESDKEVYIRFLEIVKEEFTRNDWLLSASVRPDFDKTGYNPKEMTRILDWVTIKTFDFYGSWSAYTGNHNELYASSKEYNWEKQHLNIDAVAKNWLKAGLTKEKMVLSVAFHGRSFTLKDKNQHGVHAPTSGIGPGIDNGFLRYYEICSEYKDGFKVEWDNETKTAYKYNDTVWIGFNTKDDVWIKGDYIKKNGYAGVNVFPIDGDDNKGLCGEKHILLKHLHGGMGHSVNFEKKD